MQFVLSDLGNCNFIMPKEAKSTTRNVKISVNQLTKSQTEASGIESFLKREDFKPISTKDKVRLKKPGHQDWDFPIAEQVANQCLSLPMSSYLREKVQGKVIIYL